MLYTPNTLCVYFISQTPTSVVWQMVDARRTVTIPMEAFTVHVQLVLSFTITLRAEVRCSVCQESKRIKLTYTEKYLTLINPLLKTK